MSAICGIFRFDGAPVSHRDIAVLLEALRPFSAESASWTPETAASPVGLGCRPIRVTPEDAHYRPPLHAPDHGLVLVADARIDNRTELAAQLKLETAATDQLPDAAFILAAYKRWGTEAPRHLLGDFAFALWDQREQRLFCARDGMGLRVLYYHASPQRFALASAPIALLALADIPTRLNEQKVAESLVLHQDPETTFFSEIRRLRPGHTLLASRQGVRTERYWSPAATRTIVFGSDREYVEGFNEVFDRSVMARLRAAGPIGVMLSGGLDSSAVAASAAAQLQRDGRRLTGFHAAPRRGFGSGERPGWVADESSDVEAVVAQYPNFDLWTYRTDERTPFDSDLMLFQTAGLPPRNPNNLTWFEALYSAAKAQGMTVLLNGNQGNPTISYDGIWSLRDLARQGHWAHLWREARALARETGRGTRDVLRQQVLLPLAPNWLTRANGGVRTLEQASAVITNFSGINPALVRTTGVDERVLADGIETIKAKRTGGLEYRIAALNSPADAPDLANGCRAWFGIETREPATDLRVIDYCLSIPASQYLRNGTSRWLIRRAMQGRIPDSVLERKTRGSQAADWTEWFPRMKGKILEELDRLDRSETAQRCLDLPRLRSLMTALPEPLRLEHRRTYVHLVLRAVTMGRYIRWFEESYG